MAYEKEHQLIVSCVEDLKEDEALGLIQTLVDSGDDPMAIIMSCQQGMNLVGQRYQTGEYFIAGLIMAGEILRQVVEMVQPKINCFSEPKGSGHILLGTVEGDIHDLGKDIVKILLRCSGIKVTDLGVNVSPEVFIRQAESLKPDIISISVLITTAFEGVRKTISQLRSDLEPCPAKLPIIIGGNQLDATVSDHVGADFWTRNAVDGVKYCLSVIGK